MGWLSRLLGCVPAEERAGISLGQAPSWEVHGPGDYPCFFRALADLVPAGSVLYVENCTRRGEVREYLEARPAAEICKVQMGTVWPRPECFHIPITRENMEGLAALAERHATPEVGDHIHAYRAGEVLVQWYDACCNDPLYISRSVPEERVRAFCEAIDATYGPYLEEG